MIAAFNITLTTLTPNIIANQGIGVWIGGQGIIATPANAVSEGIHAT
jgi:hypothetical protein